MHHTLVKLYFHVYVSVHECASCTLVCTHTHTDTHIHTDRQTHIHTYSHNTVTHIHTHAATHTHTHAHLHSHTHTHVYIHTHTHTHTHIYADLHAHSERQRPVHILGCRMGCRVTFKTTQWKLKINSGPSFLSGFWRESLAMQLMDLHHQL